MDITIFPTESEIPDKYKITPVEQRTYVSGGSIKHWDGAMQQVLSPVCIREGDSISQKVLGSYPLMDGTTAMSILGDAAKAYNKGMGEWSSMSVEDRISHVEKFLERMKTPEVKDKVVNMLMWEIGKTAKDSVKEYDRTVEYGFQTIEALKALSGTLNTPVELEGILGKMSREPLGTVLCMGPFNYPLNETFATMIPALIMGNSIVLKPAKYGVLLHDTLQKVYAESFPEGVINTVYGDGPTIINPMMSSGLVDGLAFIGTSKVYNIIKSQHPKPHRLRAIGGMDAKNPVFVLNDADLDVVLEEGVPSALSFNGARCTGGKLWIVQDGIYDALVQRFSDKVDSLKHGMPWVDGVTQTPLAEAGKTKYLTDLMNDAISKGARLANKGGQTVRTFFTPAVIDGVNKTMRAYVEEQFGPLVPFVKFSQIDEALQHAIDSEYGQQASIFGKDADTLRNMTNVLLTQVCRVNINSQCQRGPDKFIFAGRKNSAEGTLSVTDALNAFSIGAMVAGKATEKNRPILETLMSSKD